MSNNLTKAQEAKIPEYLERFREIGLNTDKTDRTKAEIAISALFSEINKQPGYEHTLPIPTQFKWFANPFDAAEFAARLALPENARYAETGVLDPKLPTREQIKAQASKASYGSFESYWVAFYAFVNEVVAKEKNPLVDRVVDAVKECGVYWGFKNAEGTQCVIVISEKPAEISVKDDKLHAVGKMAIRYPDNTGFYCIEGTPYRTLIEAKMAEVFGKK